MAKPYEKPLKELQTLLKFWGYTAEYLPMNDALSVSDREGLVLMVDYRGNSEGPGYRIPGVQGVAGSYFLPEVVYFDAGSAATVAINYLIAKSAIMAVESKK